MNDAPGRYHAPGRSKCARNHQALNIGRAFVYLADAHVAIDFREAELLQIAIAAKRLDCARAHRLGRLRGDELGHRGLGQAGQTRILYGSGMEGQLTRRLEPGGKVGKAEAARLMRSEEHTSELQSLMR